jgi:uncharacterized protein YecT (DUF1311 family)
MIKESTVSNLLTFVNTFMILLFLSTAALAQDCSDPQTQADMNTCSAISYKKADDSLNATYQKALGLLQKSDVNAMEDFKKIQRAWIQYRDLHCKYVAGVYEGGSIAPLMYTSCMEELTVERNAAIPDLFAEWE